MSEKNLLKFFLQTQEKITVFKEKKISLQEIKSHALKLSENNRQSSLNLKSALIKGSSEFIYEEILDEDYKKLFKTYKNSSSISSKGPSLIFPNLTSSQNCLANKKKNDASFYIKHGFFSQEYEIYEAIREEFDAITLYVKQLDHFKIQYFTEIGRDYQISISFIIIDKSDLEKAVKTDCPYLMIFTLEEKTFKEKTHEILDLMSQIPSSFLTSIYSPSIKAPLSHELKKLGAKYFVRHE